MIRSILLLTNKAKLQKVKLRNSMFLKDQMITHWFLNQDLKVAIWEEQFKFMNMSMISFLSLITILEAIPNGTTSEFQIPKLVKTIDSISSIWSSLILFTIMEWDPWCTQMLKPRKQEEDGLDAVTIFATIKTPWKERTKDITTPWPGNVNSNTIKIQFI